MNRVIRIDLIHTITYLRAVRNNKTRSPDGLTAGDPLLRRQSKAYGYAALRRRYRGGITQPSQGIADSNGAAVTGTIDHHKV